MSDMLPYVPGFQRSPAAITPTGYELKQIENKKTIMKAGMRAEAELTADAMRYDTALTCTGMELLATADTTRRALATNEDLNDQMSVLQKGLGFRIAARLQSR